MIVAVGLDIIWLSKLSKWILAKVIHEVMICHRAPKYYRNIGQLSNFFLFGIFRTVMTRWRAALRLMKGVLSRKAVFSKHSWWWASITCFWKYLDQVIPTTKTSQATRREKLSVYTKLIDAIGYVPPTNQLEKCTITFTQQ